MSDRLDASFDRLEAALDASFDRLEAALDRLDRKVRIWTIVALLVYFLQLIALLVTYLRKAPL